MSDVVPTAWQAVQYAATPTDGTLLVLGLGPIGDMCTRIARHLGVEKVYAADVVPERRARARARGVETIASTDQKDVVSAIRDATGGRGPDAVIDAVGMEAHGSPAATIAQKASAIVPDAIMEKVMLVAGVDRLAALNTAIEAVRRGGTISLSGVYGGGTDPPPRSGEHTAEIQTRQYLVSRLLLEKK